MTEKKAPVRVLVAKCGLDGHDRGAKYVANILRDAGFEVIYTGIRKSPEQVVSTALQEDVAVIGLSSLSGAHVSLSSRILSLLKEKGGDDIVFVVGGVVPENDIPKLLSLGASAVFTPGTSAETIVSILNELLEKREQEPS